LLARHFNNHNKGEFCPGFGKKMNSLRTSTCIMQCGKSASSQPALTGFLLFDHTLLQKRHFIKHIHILILCYVDNLIYYKIDTNIKISGSILFLRDITAGAAMLDSRCLENLTLTHFLKMDIGLARVFWRWHTVRFKLVTWRIQQL
jgi:hypothetical protein